MKSSLSKSTFQVTLFSIINIGVNFILQLIIAYFYGTSFERDAYLISIVIPTYLNAVFTGSLGFIFMTKFQEADSKGDSYLNSFLTSSFGLAMGLLIMIIILGMFFSSYIIKFSAPGFNESQVRFSSRLLMIVLPSSVFFNLNSFFSSIYQSRQNFLRPAIAPLSIPVISIISVQLLTSRIGIYSLAIGYLIGTFVAFAILSKICFTIKFRIVKGSFSNKAFFCLIRDSLPLFIFGFIFRFTSVYERMIASDLGPGSISYLGYANQILAILGTIASGGIAVSLFPLLSKCWIENNMEELQINIVKGLRFVFLMTIPIALMMIVFGKFFIETLLERGVFDHKSTLAVNSCLSFMMGAFIFQSLGNILIKVFYFSGKTWIISFIACLELFIYVVLGWILSKSISYIGLAVSLSASSMINIVISTIYINRNLVKLKVGRIFYDLFKILFVSFVSIYLMKLVFDLEIFVNFKLILFCFAFIFGVIIYYYLGILVKIEEFLTLKSIITKKYDNVFRSNQNF